MANALNVAPQSKRLIIEMIQFWAALESMAARLATQHASDEEIARLRCLFDSPQGSRPRDQAEHSDEHIAFHTTIVSLSGCQSIIDATRGIPARISAIRQATIRNGANRSLEHLKIIEALERRDAELAEKLTRQNALDLALQVEQHWERLGYS
jgi:DNA-binding GntR family transcriptional regulator